MTTLYPMVLSTTEPNNNVGMIKVRKYDAGTQIFDVTITENGKLKDFTGLTPFFCVKSSPKTGLGISEQIVTDVVDANNGRLKYTLTDYDMQHPQTNHAYFAFKKLKDDETFELQFTTKDFMYTTIASIFDPGIHDSNYIWTFEEMLRIFKEWIELAKEDFEKWDKEAREKIAQIIEEFKSWISENQEAYDKWLQENKDSWADFVAQNKDILEAIDPGGEILVALGTLKNFRSWDKDLISKMQNEFTERAINVKWFGVKGDGVTDDGPAIKKAHEYANSVNTKVIYPVGSYLINKVSQIPIMTDVDATNATIIIDDSYERTKPVYVVNACKDAFNLPKEQWEGLKLTTEIGKIEQFAGNGQAIYRVENSNKKVYIRYGVNSNSGINQSDMIICDNQGNVINDVATSFEDITKVTVFPIDCQKLTLDFGVVRSLANVKNDSEEYTRRNIQIRRSNTSLSVNHEVDVKDAETAPYAGFIEALQCAYVTINDCSVQIQPTKMLPSGANKSSYDLNFSEVCSLTLDNVRSKNLSSDLNGWGVFGANLLKDLVVKNSNLNRIDSHVGSHNISVLDSEIGQHGITVIGTGMLHVEKVTLHSNIGVTLREDYGANWDGPIVLRNIKHYPRNDSGAVSLLRGDPHPSHDFGYACHFGTSVLIDGYLLNDADISLNRIGLCRISTFKSEVDKTKQPYKIPRDITIKNARTTTGKKRLVAFDAVDFAYCKTIQPGRYTRYNDSNTIVPNCTIHLESDCDWYHSDTTNGCMLFVSMDATIMSYNKSVGMFGDSYFPFIELDLANHADVNLYPYAYPMVVKLDNATIRRLYAYNDGGSRAVIRAIQCSIEGMSTANGYGILRGNPLNMEFLNCIFKPIILSNGTTVTSNPELSKYYTCLDFGGATADFISLLCSIYNCTLDSKIDFSSLKTDMYSYYWDFGTLPAGEKMYKKIGPLSQRPTTNKMGNFYFDSGSNVLYLYTTTWGGYKQI